MRLHEHQWALSRVYNRLSEYTFKEFLTDTDMKEIHTKVNELIKELQRDNLPLQVNQVDGRIVQSIELNYQLVADTNHIDKDTISITTNV